MKTLFVNGKIWSPFGDFFNCFGVNGEFFDLAGSENQVSKKDYEKVVDLNGKLVIPGLIDGHIHLVYGSQMRKRMDCSNVKTADDLKEVIYKYKSEHPGEWITGSNLNIKEMLHDNLIDPIESEIPVFITNFDYHSAFCNRKFYETIHLTAFKSDEVPLNKEGGFAGILKESAMKLAFSKLPEPDIGLKSKNVREYIEVLHSFGITGISDITLPGDYGVYEKLINDKGLPLRINSYFPIKEYENIDIFRDKIKNTVDIFTIRGCKAYYDGALGSETALYKIPYKGKSSSGYKTPIAESGELNKLSKIIDKENLQMMIHAIGDEAVSKVLDIIQEVTRTNGIKERRARIEHSQHIDEPDLIRFKELRAVASVQPIHLKYDISNIKCKLDNIYENRTHNYKKLIDLGVNVNFGSDFPIAPVNPFENIKMALTRKSNGDDFSPEYKIDLHNCIKCYTINNSFAAFDEKKRGSITTGKYADFVIMKDDIFKMVPESIGKAEVMETYFEGSMMYGD